MKLAAELSKRATGNTLYILDEPTTGLHFEDVRVLLEVLHRLVDRGNTVVVIEHNLHVVKTADWVIDLGPGAGPKGGRVLYQGPLEGLPNVGASLTAQALRDEEDLQPQQPLPKTACVTSQVIAIRNARANNLKGVQPNHLSPHSAAVSQQ